MRRALTLAVLLVLSCVPAAPPRTTLSAFAPVGKARRVVLMSFDGLGADALARQAGLPTFARLAQEGASARVVNVDPTHTSSTHVSILTGATPDRHGIVANRFHIAGTDPGKVAHGLQSELSVETIVEAARRQGKRVGAVSFPTVDNTTPRRSADFGLAWTSPVVPARIVTLTRADFRREWVPPTWTPRAQRRRSYSPVMRARLEWRVAAQIRADVDVVAYDTTDDRAANYDAYFIEFDGRESAPDGRGWFSLARQTRDGLYGSWSKILRTTPSLDVTIYRGSTSRNEAWPASFRSLVDERAGFWPGEPEEDLEVGPETFAEQLERFAAYFTAAQKAAIEHESFDLLLLYQPQIDSASHVFLGVSGGEAIIRSAFVSADRAVASVAESLEPDDALIVTGDHGAVTARKEIRMNRLLADAGFAPRWRAFTSGSVAHLYRFEGADDSDAVVKMLREQGSFEVVAKKSASSHANSGDVVAWAFPEVALTPADTAPAVVTPQPRGQHGARNTHREMHPPLFAYGAGIRPGAIGEIRQTEIARFVAALLGIAPPAGAELR
jgi:predicted AlkP superfamily pyrophosphatase or phosphodiesterase